MSPIQLDPNHSVNTFADTTPEQAHANARFAYQAEVDKRNSVKVADYETQWSQYVAARDARPDATNIIAPVPARAEAVYIDANGWPYIGPSDKPVIAPHAYVTVHVTPSGFFTTGTTNASAPDPFAVALFVTVDHAGMKFLRVA